MTDRRPPSCLVVVDKPGGMTSHDVVAKVRRAMGTRKVGHAGTLDPMATGVLVLGVERATRLLGHLMLTDKTYDATIRLGVATSTDDAQGEVVATADTTGLDETAVRTALEAFVGEIEQVPSAVSAIKVDGKRAYQRVRDGEDVALEARRVTVHAIEVRSISGPEVSIRVHCSSGTYIRAIARDLGAALGVGGHLTALRRTRVGDFTLDEANTDLEHLFVTPIDRAARRSFPAYDLSAEQASDVRFGRALVADLGANGPVAVFAPDGEFLALYEQQGTQARAVAVFVG